MKSLLHEFFAGVLDAEGIRYSKSKRAGGRVLITVHSYDNLDSMDFRFGDNPTDDRNFVNSDNLENAIIIAKTFRKEAR